jgi:hypothetical protein
MSQYENFRINEKASQGYENTQKRQNIVTNLKLLDFSFFHGYF